MLAQNRLNPPRPYRAPREPSPAAPQGTGPLFVSPEDFDGTGILAGFDPCASSWWWMPELHGRTLLDLAALPAPAGPRQATRRRAPLPHAAA